MENIVAVKMFEGQINLKRENAEKMLEVLKMVREICESEGGSYFDVDTIGRFCITYECKDNPEYSSTKGFWEREIIKALGGTENVSK